MKLISIFLLSLVIGGCSNSAIDADLKNSPCACNYDGQQLITEPTTEQLKEIADLQFSRA